MEVALDGALPLDGPDGLDQLFAAGLEAGRGGEVGQNLEGPPQPAVEIALPVLVPLAGERAAQQTEDVGRPAGRFVPLALGGRRQRRDRGSRDPLPAPAALALQQAGEEVRQPVAVRPFDPETESVDQAPGIVGTLTGIRPFRGSVEQKIDLLPRQGAQHLLPQEEAHGRQVQQSLRPGAFETLRTRGFQGKPQRPVPAVRGIPQTAREERRRLAAGDEKTEGGDLGRIEQQLLGGHHVQANRRGKPAAGDKDQPLPWNEPALGRRQPLGRRLPGGHEPADSLLMSRFEGLAQRRFAGPRLQHSEGKPPRPPALAGEERLDDGRDTAARPTPELDER